MSASGPDAVPGALVTGAGPALRGLSRFAGRRGIPAGREFLLDYDVIEAFCVTGLPGARPCTRGTYRSALYRLAARVHGEPGQRGTPFAGARPPPPYSLAERAELAAIAAAQRDPARRASALAVVVFGIGAGLRPGELVALRGSEVTRHGRRELVLMSADHYDWLVAAARRAHLTAEAVSVVADAVRREEMDTEHAALDDLLK